MNTQGIRGYSSGSVCDEIDRDLSDLRARRNYLLDSRTGPDDVMRATELAWLDAHEKALLKRRSSRTD